MTPTAVRFQGGDHGPWRVEQMRARRGEPLPGVAAVQVVPAGSAPGAAVWSLTGVESSLRYTTASERADLAAVSPALGRPQASRAVLVPVRKTDAWWALAQDERRAVLDRSDHLGQGRRALPAVARRLLHSRDLGGPFDFLTWFEFAPPDEPLFDRLLTTLRASEEWRYVEREVEIRLRRASHREHRTP